MKNSTLLFSNFFIGLLMLFNLSGQAQWSKQITNTWINDIQMADPNNGFATDGGQIYKTNDGGINWNLSKPTQKYGFQLGLYTMNKDTAFDFGFLTYQHYTHNSGTTWDSTLSPSPNETFYEMTSFNKDTCVIVGNVGIYQSPNCGKTWKKVLSTSSEVTDVQFINKNTAYACNWYGGFYKTTNNGSNWSKIANDSIYQISFINDTIGYGINYNNNNIEKTIDGGYTWNTSVNLPWNDFGYLTDIAAYSNYVMVACSTNYFTYAYSEDNGITWFKYVDTKDFFGMNSINLLHDSMVWCSGNTGICYSFNPFSGGTALNTDSVWPGDANANKTANIYDALNIGIAYGKTGPARTGASLNWQAQAATDWGKTFKNNVDYKHVDCDGNGKIDYNDLQAIIANYGLMHSKTSNTTKASATDPFLYLQFLDDSVAASTSISIPIYFGSSNVPIDSLYGIAFSVNYDTSLIKSASISADFSNSWLGTINTDMFSLTQNLPSNSRIDIALSRTNQQDKLSSFGQIGELNVVTSDNISGKTLITKTLQLSISNVSAITAAESILSVNTSGDSIVVYQNISGVSDILIDEDLIQLFPNPAKDNIIINSNGVKIKSVKMFNVLSQNDVELMNDKSQINLSNYSAGMYLLQLETNKGIVLKKFVKE